MRGKPTGYDWPGESFKTTNRIKRFQKSIMQLKVSKGGRLRQMDFPARGYTPLVIKNPPSFFIRV